MVRSNGVVGLLKFFREEEYLEDLIGGKVYCNTPEYYRLHPGAGVGDADESASVTYRHDRDDWDPELYVEGQEIEGVLRYTLRNTGASDRWLHCWTALEYPESEDGWLQLAKDYQRIMDEFGSDFAFLPATNVDALMERIDSATKHDVDLRKVSYSEEIQRLGPSVKRMKFAYQREVRILVGECQASASDPLIIECPDGFEDLLQRNPSIRVQHSQTDDILFEIGAD